MSRHAPERTPCEHLYDIACRELDEMRAANVGAVRAAFRAGFVAHPEAEAPVFKWSFDAEGCIAADREESAWRAWCDERKAALREALRPLVGGA